MDDLDKQSLWIASLHHTYDYFIEKQIRSAGMTPGEFFHRLDRLACDPEAQAYDPVTIQRLRDAKERSSA